MRGGEYVDVRYPVAHGVEQFGGVADGAGVYGVAVGVFFLYFLLGELFGAFKVVCNFCFNEDGDALVVFGGGEPDGFFTGSAFLDARVGRKGARLDVEQVNAVQREVFQSAALGGKEIPDVFVADEAVGVDGARFAFVAEGADAAGVYGCHEGGVGLLHGRGVDVLLVLVVYADVVGCLLACHFSHEVCIADGQGFAKTCVAGKVLQLVQVEVFLFVFGKPVVCGWVGFLNQVQCFEQLQVSARGARVYAKCFNNVCRADGFSCVKLGNDGSKACGAGCV